MVLGGEQRSESDVWKCVSYRLYTRDKRRALLDRVLLNMDQKELKIYLRLDGEQAKVFQQIKRRFGVKNDTEVIRLLITWYYTEHVQRGLR